MKINFGLDAEEVAAAAAEHQKRVEEDRRAIEECKAIRAVRLTELEKRKDAIERATALYERLDHGDHPDVRLRAGLIRLATERPVRGTDPYLKTVEGDVATRPPLTKLIHRPSNALQVYLTLLYAVHLEYEPGDYPRNERDNSGDRGWVELCGLMTAGPSNRELNLRLTRALSKLAKQNLVSVGAPRSAKRFDKFGINREDGSRKKYLIPSASSPTASIPLPAAFFLAGWHLVLTAEEMATLLVIAELTQRLRLLSRRNDREDAGVGLSQTVRWAWYGLAPEAYASRHELAEFGLIDMYDPMDRNYGKLTDDQRNSEDLRAPRLTYPAAKLPDYSRPAINVVIDCLKTSKIPPRLVDKARALGLDVD